MQHRRVPLASVVVFALAGSPGIAAPIAVVAAPGVHAVKPDTRAAENESFLRQMGDAQKWMGEEVWKIKDKVDALPGIIAETKEDHAAVQEEVDKLREEVKGLYVEISSVKQQIDEVKTDIAGVNTNVSSFRTSSGIFLAVVMLAVVFSAVMNVFRR